MINIINGKVFDNAPIELLYIGIDRQTDTFI